MTTAIGKINKIFKDNLGRDLQAEGAGYWLKDYNKMRDAGVSEADALKSITANVQRSEEYKNKATTTKPDRKHWQRGEDSTGKGNFHDMEIIKTYVDPETKTKTKLKDFTDQITAYFEEKGLIAGTPAMDAKVTAALSSDTAADAFRTAMKSTPTGEERGDTWGTKGRAFLLAEAQRTNVDTTGQKRADLAKNLVNKLYVDGFGREADQEGLKFWTNALYEGKTTYAQLAATFLGSDEARLRDEYHTSFGRDADDVGLQHWLKNGKAGADAGIAHIRSGASFESQARDLYSKHLGQHSKYSDRDANYFTDVAEGGAKNLDWTNVTVAGGGLGVVQEANKSFQYDFGKGSSDWKTKLFEGSGISKGDNLQGIDKEIKALSDKTMTIGDLETLLKHKERIQNIGSTYDTDDAAGGTKIGNLFTVKELEEDYKLSDYKDQNAYKALGDKLGKETWNLLEKELGKFYIEDTKPGYTGDVGVDPGKPEVDLDQRNKHRNTLHSDYDVPVPPDYKDKAKATVTREETDYMSKWDGSYGKKLGITDYKVTDKPKQLSRSVAPFMAGQSAQGVRRKRSGAFRSGASATGTKQFQRDNMKIKSLNL